MEVVRDVPASLVILAGLYDVVHDVPTAAVIVATFYTVYFVLFVFMAWRDGKVTGFWTMVQSREIRFETPLKRWSLTVIAVLIMAGFWWLALYGFSPDRY